jgi:hypothetical protein
MNGEKIERTPSAPTKRLPMPTRTIKLKMILPQSERGRGARLDLWTTHTVVNEAVKRIENVLLFCRGNSYVDTEGNMHCRDEVRSQAIRYARDIQRENGHPDEGDDDRILVLLRCLYEKIIPSSVKPKTGDAQHARGFVRPLMSPASKGGCHQAASILDPLPEWVTMKSCGQAGWETASRAWATSSQAIQLMSSTGRKPTWTKQYQQGEYWQDAFVAHQGQLRKEVAGGPLDGLRNIGLLPLLPPPIRSRLKGVRGGVSPWEDLAVRLAASHLISWESNDHRVRTEYAELAGRIEHLKQQVDEDALNHVQTYERLRHDELKRIALADDDSPYRVGRRSLRGWELIRERWQSPECRSSADRMKVLAEMQTRLRGRFGDPHFYRWLAQESQEPLWREADPLPHIVLLNDAMRRLARKKDCAAFTTADPRLHPRWIQ